MGNRFVRLLEFATREYGPNNAWSLSELDELQYFHEVWVMGQYRLHGLIDKYNLKTAAIGWMEPGEFEHYVEMKAEIKKVLGYLPAQVLESESLFSGQLSSLFRTKTNKRIQRFKGTDGLFRYWIK